jgi:hypothetical protein
MDTNIAEKVERYNEVGQVVRVTLRWRGKIYYLQMFFPGSKFPSRGEVETQVKKIYPDAVVMIHYASETQPNQPLIRVAEDVERDEYGDPVGGPKISKKEKEKNLKKNEKDEDHTTTTTEGTLKYGNYGNYIDGQKRDKTKEVKMKKVDYTKLAASNELEGEVIKEEEEKQNPTFVQFMQRIEQLPEVTREAIKNCGNDPAIAKAALEISGIDK